MDGPIDPAAPGQLAVGRVDDGVDGLVGDVPLVQFENPLVDVHAHGGTCGPDSRSSAAAPIQQDTAARGENKLQHTSPTRERGNRTRDSLAGALGWYVQRRTIERFSLPE